MKFLSWQINDSFFTSREAAWSCRSVGRKKEEALAFLVIVTSVFGVFGTFWYHSPNFYIFRKIFKNNSKFQKIPKI